MVVKEMFNNLFNMKKEQYFGYSQSAIDWIEKNNAVMSGGGLSWVSKR
jgi:hypothetical protein